MDGPEVEERHEDLLLNLFITKFKRVLPAKWTKALPQTPGHTCTAQTKMICSKLHQILTLTFWAQLWLYQQPLTICVHANQVHPRGSPSLNVGAHACSSIINGWMWEGCEFFGRQLSKNFKGLDSSCLFLLVFLSSAWCETKENHDDRARK